MDKRVLNERFKKLGFIPQKENVYNKLLPYADKLDEESTKLFFDIKTNLVKSVLAREMRPGCALWTSRLNKYMKIYGLKFSKEDHICLIKLYYDLLTQPNLEPTRINKFAATLSFLLKKEYLLSQDDLQLDWKPLYDLCTRLVEHSKNDIGMYRYSSGLETTLENLIRCARVYFPVTATQEILDQFRPQLCPYSNSEIASAIEYLEIFLPITVKPEDSHKGYKLWFEELMSLWEICHNANIWESHLATLMARLAKYNIGYIDWEPYIPIMFVRFLRTLHLPVGYKQKQSSKMYKIDINAMTMWIVCTLGGGRDTPFIHLEQFMQMLESYCHPANTGRWTPKIREFLKKISYYFVQRIHYERYRSPSWDYYSNPDYKLTDAEIDRFVYILKPCIEQAIFMKQGVQDIVLTLNYLACLRPNILIPITLEKLYSSMDSLTEPHKLTSSMVCVTAVSRYMVQGAKNGFVEGPSNVLPLLNALLPGIDPNDLRKCFLTFNFIMSICTMCPIVNSSDANRYYDDLTDEEHIVCEQTAGFEDFLIQFLDRIFTWIESNSLEFTRMELSDNNFNDVKSKTDSMSEGALILLVTTVLMQCSTDIFISALKKLYNFVTTRLMELNVSGKLVATLCHAFVKVNPAETMKMFVPYLCDTIERLLDEHDDVMNEERLNGELLYNLLLLSEVVDGKSEIVHYIDRLTRILDKTLYMKSTEANKMSATLLQVIIFSLSFTQPREYRSVSQSLDTHVKDFLPIRSWGCAGDLNNLNMQWYTPGEKEIACIQSIMNKYLVPELEKLQQYSAGKLSLSRDDLHRSLKIIISLLGAQAVLPLWKEPALQLVDSAIEPWAFELIVGGPYIVTMPDGRNIRKVIADVVCGVQRYVQEHDEGDTVTIKSIIQIYDVLLFNKHRGRDFEMHWKSHHLTKKNVEDRLHQNKMHIRNVLIDRVMLHQEFRNDSRCCSFTETHKQLMLALFELAVSRYSAIRICAQCKLFNVVSTYSYSYIILTPYLKEILMLDSVEHHEKFKGCLYILLGPKGTPIIARHNWEFIKEIWPTLILSKPSEKQSIVSLMNSLNDVINRYFPTIHINLELSENCIERAKDLTKTIKDITLADLKIYMDSGEDKMMKKSELNFNTYNGIMDMLLNAAANKNLHWRHQTMCLSLIQYLIHPDVKYNVDVVKYFLIALINDSIAIRKIALKVVLFISFQNKPKFKKITKDPFSYSSKPEKIIPGIRSDNKWLLYNSKTIPKDCGEWDNPRYIHDQYTGFYAWPKKLEVYAPSSDQITFDKRKNNLSLQEAAMYEFFTNCDNINSLIKYWSMEEKKGRDQFNMYRFCLIKNLFKTFEDSLLHLFVPHLEKLVSDTQEHNQRCASELISGIIQGSKHWSFEKVEKLWTILLPILRTAFTNITDETIVDWGVAMAMSVEYRDPNRHHWLLEFLIDNPLSEPTSFIGCARIYMLQSALNQQPWRNAELINRLLEYFKDYLSHPFQNVREKISACLVSLFCKDIVFPEGSFTNCPRVTDFFGQILPKLNMLYVHSLKSFEHVNDINDIDLATNQLESVTLNEADKEECIRLFKTISKYVTGSVARMNYSAVSEHYSLLPLACILQNNDNDDELKTICSNFLAILGSTIILDKYVPAALEAAVKVSTCPSWSARSAIVEFMSVLVFHNMAIFITREEWVSRVQNMVLLLLEDIQPEVRMQAGKVLSGLLHCKFLPTPMELLETFKQKAKTKLKRSTATSKYQKNGLNLSVRHAGVLGMCAFISSHPYDVPDYLPNIFGELGAHLNDPQPIPATIRKTLGDFKRTHHDNWEIHKLKFTEEELSVLSDLTVPPSYYA